MAAPLCTVVRDNRGRFSTDKAAIREKRDDVRRKRVKQNIILEHNYSIATFTTMCAILMDVKTVAQAIQDC